METHVDHGCFPVSIATPRVVISSCPNIFMYSDPFSCGKLCENNYLPFPIYISRFNMGYCGLGLSMVIQLLTVHMTFCFLCVQFSV